MKAFIGILFLSALCAVGTALAVVEVDLTVDPRHLAYEARSSAHFQAGIMKNGGFGPPGILFDVDNDGYLDLVRSGSGYVCAVGFKKENIVTYYQTNFPPKFCRDQGSSFSLAGNMDLDGDGQVEIVVTGHTEDHLGWRFWTIDPYSGKILGSFDLGGGKEVRPDGIWDGNYTVVGMLECSVGGIDRTALVLCVNIGFDLEGRGVMAVDPWTGEILWRFVTGPNPLGHSTRVVDLDRDGQAEVVIYGRAPDNLGGRKINGYSDNESRLFVLDNQGELLWTKRLGGWYGSGYLIIGDMNADGFDEIITSTHTTPEVWGEVVVWSPDGESLARHTVEDQYQNMALIPGDKDRLPRLAVSAASGAVSVFEYTLPDLNHLAKIETDLNSRINCVADLLPTDGFEMVLTSQNGITWVLDRNYRPVARFEGDRKRWTARLMPWRPAPGLDLLIREFGPGFPLLLVKAPPAPLNIALISAVVAAVLFFGAGFVFWKKFPVTHRSDPAVLRETRLNLLEDLEISNHGAMAPLKCVRRLVWHMNAMTTGLGDNSSIEVRLRETWAECVDNALPHLAGILDRVRLAGLASASVDFAARALGRIDAGLLELEKEDFQVSYFETLAEKLTAATAQADDALWALRRVVAGYFYTDLVTTMTRVVRANSQGLEHFRVTVQTGYLAQAAAGGDDFSAVGANPDVTCLIDSKELEFVLDNLVGNAVRAMEDSNQRNLSLTWTVADGMVTLDVRDTGCGIPAEHRGRILDTRFSTREGGGKGLPRSLKILRKYGGGLMILDTAAGKGTTFRVTLPVAG